MDTPKTLLIVGYDYYAARNAQLRLPKTQTPPVVTCLAFKNVESEAKSGRKYSDVQIVGETTAELTALINGMKA